MSSRKQKDPKEQKEQNNHQHQHPHIHGSSSSNSSSNQNHPMKYLGGPKKSKKDVTFSEEGASSAAASSGPAATLRATDGSASSDLVEVAMAGGSPEQHYIQTLKLEITRLRKKLDDALDNNGEILRAKASHIEDKINLQRALAENEVEIQNIKSQYLQSIQSLKSEMNAKSDSLRSLEETLATEKDKSMTYLESIAKYEKEMSEREEFVKASKDEVQRVTLELSTLASSQKVLAEKLQSSDEKNAQLAGLVEALKAEKKQNQETILQLERKVNEFVEREGFLANDGARMANTITQQHENYDQMNQLIAQMKLNMTSLKEQRDSENSRANICEQRLAEVSKVSNELQQKKIEYEDRILNVEKQNKVLLIELKKSQTMLNEIKEGRASMASRIENLEKEKVALVLEQINHVKEIEHLRHGLEMSDNNFNDIKEALEQEIRNKQTILAAQKYDKNDIKKLQEDKEELAETIAMLTKDLKDADTMKSEIQEMYRNQQNESMAKLDEYAQKNSQLMDEISLLRDSLAKVDEVKSKQLSDWDAERSNLLTQISSLRQKVSVLDDQNEELSAKLESSKSEADELKSRIKEYSKKEDERVEILHSQHAREVEKVRANMREEFDIEMKNTKENYQKVIEEKYRGIILTSKEANEKKFAVQASKINELTSELQETKTLLQNSESSLKKECEKYATSIQQMRDLRKISEENTGKLQDKLRSLEKEKALAIAKYSAEVEDQSEQIANLHESIKRKDQNIEMCRVQLNSEKEQRFSLSQRLLELEEYQSKSKLQERLDAQKLQNVNDQIRQYQSKYDSLKADSETEIQRLQKRNDLLLETVSKLTNITKDASVFGSVSPRLATAPEGIRPTEELRSIPDRRHEVTRKTSSSSLSASSTLPGPAPSTHAPSMLSAGAAGTATTPTAAVLSAQEERRKFLRITLENSKASADASSVHSEQPLTAANEASIPSSSPSPSSLSLSNPAATTPGHRAVMSQQVNSAIHRVQEAIDKRKMKAFEAEVNAAKVVDPKTGEESMVLTDTVRLMRADVESISPRSRISNSASSSPNSKHAHSKSFSEKLRENIRTSQDLESIGTLVTSNVDLNEEY